MELAFSYNEALLIFLHCLVLITLIRRRYRDPLERLTRRDIRLFIRQFTINLILYVFVDIMFFVYPRDLIWTTTYYFTVSWIISHCVYSCVMHELHIPLTEGAWFFFIKFLQTLYGNKSELQNLGEWWQAVRSRAQLVKTNLLISDEIQRLLSDTNRYIDHEAGMNHTVLQLPDEIVNMWGREKIRISSLLFPKNNGKLLEQIFDDKLSKFSQTINDQLSNIYAKAPINVQLLLIKQAIYTTGASISQDFITDNTCLWIMRYLDQSSAQEKSHVKSAE